MDVGEFHPCRAQRRVVLLSPRVRSPSFLIVVLEGVLIALIVLTTTVSLPRPLGRAEERREGCQ